MENCPVYLCLKKNKSYLNEYSLSIMNSYCSEHNINPIYFIDYVDNIYEIEEHYELEKLKNYVKDNNIKKIIIDDGYSLCSNVNYMLITLLYVI